MVAQAAANLARADARHTVRQLIKQQRSSSLKTKLTRAFMLTKG